MLVQTDQTTIDICSPEHTLSSNEVLSILREKLIEVPMKVETGKTRGSKIPVPVLFDLIIKLISTLMQML